MIYSTLQHNTKKSFFYYLIFYILKGTKRRNSKEKYPCILGFSNLSEVKNGIGLDDEVNWIYLSSSTFHEDGWVYIFKSLCVDIFIRHTIT